MTDKKPEKKYPEPIVGALIINENGKILLAESPKWYGLWTIFGGHIELGEDLEYAVKREVKEETGLDVEIAAKLGFSDSVFDKKFHEKKHFIFADFLCKYKGKDTEVSLNKEYSGKSGWFSLEEALKLNLAEGTKLIIKEYEEYLEDKKKVEYLDGWKRCQADFENYKKRQAETQKDFIRFSTESIILQLLPVLDNFHASTDHVPEDQKDKPWVTGIMHIQKQLESVLTTYGVTEIETKIGDDFNPEIHEAVEENTEHKTQNTEHENKVKKVIQRGYKIDGKVIRPARVIVE